MVLLEIFNSVYVHDCKIKYLLNLLNEEDVKQIFEDLFTHYEFNLALKLDLKLLTLFQVTLTLMSTIGPEPI